MPIVDLVRTMVRERNRPPGHGELMRGPGMRHKLDVRRLWRCPRCGAERRLPADVTTVHCVCGEAPFMQIVEPTRRVRPIPILPDTGCRPGACVARATQPGAGQSGRQAAVHRSRVRGSVHDIRRKLTFDWPNACESWINRWLRLCGGVASLRAVPCASGRLGGAPPEILREPHPCRMPFVASRVTSQILQ